MVNHFWLNWDAHRTSGSTIDTLMALESLIAAHGLSTLSGEI